ncbi:MAG: T9SS type A sorting domain-containing protein [Saprospiraceae bacterium]
MNIRTIALVFLPLFLFFIACENPQSERDEEIEEEEEEFDSSEEAMNHKQLPFDLSSFQRAYPDKTFDVRGYKSAFTDAIAKSNSRSVTAPDGFDTDWTTQGPGNAGARINIIEIDPNDDDVIYIGFSGGGIFKTTNDGDSWAPIFDDQPYLSIGAIEVDPNNSNTVFAGTGDPNITGYPFIGNGVYKSLDGGDTWTQSGLSNTGVVSEIIIDPTNSNIIYTATMGNPFAYTNDRGLYKSTDGGSSWTQILFVNDHAGIIDIAMNPDDTDIIYATGWDRIRTNQESIASGDGGRIFRSEDGGSSWETLDDGLPIKNLSRSSIAISPDDPDVLYASIVDSTYFPHGIYKSEDGGDSWDAVTEGNSDNGLINPLSNFGWYFGRIFVNPTDDDRAYLCGVRLWSTANSGSGWSVLPPTSGESAPHVDNHYIAFNSNGDLYLATDGGLYKNPNNTSTWLDIEDIPATQVYRVAYNPHETDTYYGGCQDNGTQAGNAAGIANWDRVFGADGFQAVFHPTNPDTFYFETQNGNIWRTNGNGGFFSYDTGINNSDRKNWDMPYMMSAHESETLYAGTHRMYRHDPSSSPAWYPISNHLTDGNIYGSAYHTISALHESPVDASVLYAGTTDGNVWRSTNTGSSWTNITGGLPNRYVTCIKADPNNPNDVYVSHSGYKYNEEIDHIHYSSDQGTTWTDISGDLPQMGINHIEVMPNNNGNVIFVATDAGVYATLNGGNSWDRLGTGFPFVTTYDLDLNVANNLLIAGTFGRSILTFPLDSIGVSFTPPPPPPSADIAGNIFTYYGDPVGNVEVEQSGSPSNTDITDELGNYEFSDIPTGQEVEITPYKNDNPENGLSGFDVIKIQRHILRIDTLNPYQIIASDINSSGSVTSYDLILLTKLILDIDSVFSSNTSWRFVRATHNFADTLFPFPYPEVYNFDPLMSNQSAVDFIGIKIGDVTEDADGNALLEADSRNYDGTLSMKLQDKIFKKGELVNVLLSVEDFNEILGYQMTLKYDDKVLGFQSTESKDLANVGVQDFGKRYIDSGFLTTIWTNATAVESSDETELFQVQFLAKADGKLSEVLEVNNKHTRSEVYRGLDEVLNIEFDWAPAKTLTTEEATVNEIILQQNVPNPVRNVTSTSVAFSLPAAMQASFELYNTNGEMIWSQNQQYDKGQHQIELPSKLFGESGIYLYQLKTKNGFTCTKRILYLD